MIKQFNLIIVIIFLFYPGVKIFAQDTIIRSERFFLEEGRFSETSLSDNDTFVLALENHGCFVSYKRKMDNYYQYLFMYNLNDTFAITNYSNGHTTATTKIYFENQMLYRRFTFNRNINGLLLDQNKLKKKCHAGEYYGSGLSKKEAHEKLMEGVFLLNVEYFICDAATFWFNFYEEWDSFGNKIIDYISQAEDNRIEYIEYYSNGQIKTNGYYTFTFFALPQSNSITDVFFIEYYAKTGLWKSFFMDGSMNSIGGYYKNEKCGYWQYYSESGNLSEEYHEAKYFNYHIIPDIFKN